MVGWLAGWLADWLERSVGWSVGRLAGWVGGFDCWLAGQPTNLPTSQQASRPPHFAVILSASHRVHLPSTKTSHVLHSPLPHLYLLRPEGFERSGGGAAAGGIRTLSLLTPDRAQRRAWREGGRLGVRISLRSHELTRLGRHIAQRLSRDRHRADGLVALFELDPAATRSVRVTAAGVRRSQE